LFLYGDEIIYKCDQDKIPQDDNMISTQSSICGADGQWTVAPLRCANKCDATFHITDSSAEEEKCGYVTTGNYPEVYQSDDECYWIIHDQRSVSPSSINYKFRDLQLDYNSVFQLSCQKDQVFTFYSQAENGDGENVKDGSSGICDYESSGILSKSKGMTVKLEEVKESNSSYVEFQFIADAQLENHGILIEWWSAEMTEEDRPAGCLYNGTLAVKAQANDHMFGIIYDSYHGIYICILIAIILFLIYKLIVTCYQRLNAKDAEYPEIDESEESESDSDDESDILDQYDLDQDEDDVDDFSLLTLLEMKANRTELGTAVEKLTQEIDTLENFDDVKPEEVKPDLSNSRRMSNVNKIHSK